MIETFDAQIKAAEAAAAQARAQLDSAKATLVNAPKPTSSGRTHLRNGITPEFDIGCRPRRSRHR